MTENGQGPPKYVRNSELQLEIKALRSDVKLWILAAVAANQILDNVNIPTAITAAAVVGVVAKTAFSLLFALRGGGS